MNTISTQTFKHILRDIHKHTESRKFCFVLGSGSSYKSGIPTGGSLAEKWYQEITDRYSKAELNDWKEGLKDFNENELASHYGDIYKKRFESDKASGYEFLVQAMKEAKPTFGHIVLAQILTKTEGHSVLTTNFDSLVETAIYQFTDKTPLVCGHESLSGYARPSNLHPLIIKVHRDLLLAPKSNADDIDKLAEGWKEPLDNLFSNHIPIVIGYGGNDGSLMTYFEEMNKPSNFFWCELKGQEPPKRAQELVASMEGSFIEIDGFDEIMHELLWVFDEIKPIKDELEEITQQRIKTADIQFDKLEASVQIKESKPANKTRELSAFEYATKADEEPNFEKRKAIYLKAVEKHPNTSWLWNHFTYFLHFVKTDYDNLEEYYLKAMEIEPNNAANNGNYAIFLNHIKKDYVKAEKHYLKVLEIQPNDADFNGNYANFLKDIKKDYVKAEKYYLKALEIQPNHAINNENYAIFLGNIKKNYEKAEKYFLKALEIQSNDADFNGNYASFLNGIKKDYENAEKHYLKALEIEPNYANNNGNYAQFLLTQSKKIKGKEFLQKAFNLNEKEKQQDLYLELWFYRYAHFYKEYLEAANEIEMLLSNGVKSIGWSFDNTIDTAIKEGHPEPEKLKEFAKRITEAD